MEAQEGTRERSEEFVTVVNVAPVAESFVTVLSIGNGKPAGEDSGSDPAHPEEEVEVYRLPGERLGFGLKFDGGNKTSERVRRLFIQSCAEQSPASRASCSWGNLGEGDEVLSVDGVPVSQMTRLDCVRRLKESQLVIKLSVRCRGALRPEVVSAERKPGSQLQGQGYAKSPPELPTAPPPVPPRKSRLSAQTTSNRGSADGEASPGIKKAWDSPKSVGSSQSGSPQSQGSFRSAASSIRSSNYDSCSSSSAKCYSESKTGSPKVSLKPHISPVINKTKQELPPEAQSYLDARSQDGSSNHGSTSDDTSSSLSTVIERFSSSDRFSMTSTFSTAAEQSSHPHGPLDDNQANSDILLDSGIVGLSNPDFLLSRLANSEARTFVESRGDVELITAVVAPNTVVIEETPTLQPPLSFQDAPLSYGHEPRPGIFYSADLAADSKTHFRPIKDDAELVEKVFNGAAKEAPPLPTRNHVNRIAINQQWHQAHADNSDNRMPVLPPKPMPRKELKSKRKRDLSNVSRRRDKTLGNNEVSHAIDNFNDVIDDREEVIADDEDKPRSLEETSDIEAKEEIVANDENARGNVEEIELQYKTNKVLEIVEMKKAKAMMLQKEPSRTSEDCEVPVGGANASAYDDSPQKSYAIDVVEMTNSVNSKGIADTSTSSPVAIELEDVSDDEGGRVSNEAKEKKETNERNGMNEMVDVGEKDEIYEDTPVIDFELRKVAGYGSSEIDRLDEESDEDTRFFQGMKNQATDDIDGDEDDMTDESDDDDYYWQSNLATIGEEEENNSLEYDNANEDHLPALKSTDNLQIIEHMIESAPGYLDENAVVNGRMDNCGGGGQRLPPDGDEFPTAYQEFTNPNQPYQYVTKRETVAANGDVDRGETMVVDVSAFVPVDKATLVAKTLNTNDGRGTAETRCKKTEPLETRRTEELPDMDGDKRSTSSNYTLYGTQTSFAAPSHEALNEKTIDIAAYAKPYDAVDAEVVDGCPPPLPLTGPPKVSDNHERKFATSGELWRQDNKSEKSVKDKIAMFSSRGSLEAPLFPTSIAATTTCSPSSIASSRRLSKHKSSDDVFAEEMRSPVMTVERTQSFFDLSADHHRNDNHHPKSRNAIQSGSPPTSPRHIINGYSHSISPENNKYPGTNADSSADLDCRSNDDYATSHNDGVVRPRLGHNKSFDATQTSLTTKLAPNGLTRAMSFSGSANPYYSHDRPQTANESFLGSSSISRTNSLASTFKRPSDDMRKSSLNQLIEQRRKGISKLRGLVIPEKDAVPADQLIIDLPEIKSRDSILNSQVPRSNIQDKWGSQSSLISNSSAVSSSLRINNAFKMPAPKILSNYSPAFKRKSLTAYAGSQSPNSIAALNNSKNNANNQLTSPDAPKSLESICSPTRSDYSFDFVSSSGSPDNNLPLCKPKLNGQRKNGRNNEYDDSDNDSAVSSSQSSISRGFSPPMSPVPSDRSTVSSERSYLSESHYHQRPQLILDSTPNKTNGTTIITDKTLYSLHNARANIMTEMSYSIPEKLPSSNLITTSSSDNNSNSNSSNNSNNNSNSQPTESNRSSQIPQRQPLKRSSSNETNSSNSNSSTLTSGSPTSAESLSRRVLKPQSVEAINRKNILASARCRSGRDLNGSPLIQRKFTDEEEAVAANGATVHQVNGGFVNAHRVTNGGADCTKPRIKIAYIEITENVVVEGEKFSNQKMEEQQQQQQQQQKQQQLQQQPRLPPKRSIIPQAKNVPLLTSRSPKSEAFEPSSDMKSWMRAEMRTFAEKSNDRANSYEPRKKSSPLCDIEATSSNNRGASRSKSTLALHEQNSPTALGSSTCQSYDDDSDVDFIGFVKPKSRSNVAVKKTTDDHHDLLTVLTTKSRSRSTIHVEETSYGSSKCQMSLEDMLGAARGEKNGIGETWTTDEKLAPTRIPMPSRSGIEELDGGRSSVPGSKIPTPRNLGRRSASVTDMKKAFEKPEATSPFFPTPHQLVTTSPGHNRFPSLDSSVEEGIRCEVDQERFNGEQFGSISSLASTTSLISQQELAQLVDEANLDEPRGGHDVVVVLLHKENPSGSVGITLAGGVDCETKEISVHRVLAHSIADKEGSLQRGDRILSINGRSTRGLTHRESLAVLKQPRPELVLVLSRAKLEEGVAKLRARTESVETIVEDYETGGMREAIAWGPASMVAMYKDGAGLGFSLEGGRDSPLGDRPLLIKKIFTGGAAEKTGALRAGDQLLEVNKRDVSRMSRIEAWSFMKKVPDGEVTLLVKHPATKSS
ncbi:PREDICTED: LOW QUALITY PROTEIN: uncharacterized protein LOC105359493 [Ceratosolen solmsi marchali]|uniref:LOW QUALITY PROTEIN: uncharacterized protein LOC105359493 n=1 Tax=Ceratosolen solmsi marchali TaxID=326594 RepID=A0AAJ6VL67_9HYME|nr:PREDICTED: LOW QUALITY PROTEIN: uncharacterized protein LOC105359493 [Ceratosolen solmsi marchali]